MIFLLGFLIGFITCFIFTCILYGIVRELIFKYGRTIVNKTEATLNKFENATMDRTQIVYPDVITEAFNNNDELNINDILNE